MKTAGGGRPAAMKTKPKATQTDFFTRIPSPSRSILTRCRDDGAVIIMKLDNETHFFQLDHVAAEFWELINGRRTIEQICSILIKRHDPPRAVLLKEVKSLVRWLIKHRMIQC